MTLHIAYLVFDTTFLAAWVVVSWLIQRLTAALELRGLDGIMLTIYEYVFSGSLLIVILAYVIKDLFVLVSLQTRKAKQALAEGDEG